MSYDMEGWQYNEGSGSSDWLNQVMNYNSDVPNYEPGFNYGEPFNYEPGYNNDDSGNYSYNYGFGNNEPNESPGGASGGGGNYSVGSQWADTSGSSTKSASNPSSSVRTPSQQPAVNTGQWLNTVVTQAMEATKALPTYSAPTWNKDRIKALTQKNFGTTANQMGNKVSEAITRSQSMDNPLLQKEYMRGTLRGYGEGLGSAHQSAGTKALTEYTPEHQSEVDAAKTMYDAALKDYLATMKTVTKREYERFTY